MESNFVWFNFRGKVRFLRKDTIEMCPYLELMINSPSQNIETDTNGYIMIDEDYKDVIYCIKLYQLYLETGKTKYLYILSATASRLGYDSDFVSQMRESPLRLRGDYKKRELEEAAKNTKKLEDCFISFKKKKNDK
jgi:hypothetical protein